MHGWFLPALGLALLGGAGFAVLRRPAPHWSAIVLLIVLCATCWSFNQLQSAGIRPRRASSAVRRTAARVSGPARGRPPRSGACMGPPMTAVGYRNHPLQSRVETTYGYNPLELAAYAEYADAAESNPRLVDRLRPPTGCR